MRRFIHRTCAQLTQKQTGLAELVKGICGLDGRSQTGEAGRVHGILWNEQQ